MLTTNRDVSSIPLDLTKCMVASRIDAAILENRSVGERLARRSHREVGTALYRAYLQRLMPEVRATRAEIDGDSKGFPGLSARSSALLRARSAEGCSALDACAGLCRLLQPTPPALSRQARGHAGRRGGARGGKPADGKLVVSFGRDVNQFGQFARSVPDFVLHGRFADVVRLDLAALEDETGLDAGHGRSWWRQVLWR